MSTPQSPASIFNASGPSERAEKPICYRHRGTPADTTCFTCLKAICKVCTLQDFEGAQCVECSAKKRSAKKARALGLALSAVMAAAVGVSLLQRVEFELPYDYGTHTREVRQLEDQLHKTPCDKRDMLRLAELMLGAGNEPGVIKRAEAFFTECKDWPRLRWVTYEAYKRSGQNDLAIAEATRLIEDGPEDKDFRWWRGVVHERKGDFLHAAQDYAQSIALQPALSSVPFYLATALEKVGRPCEGIRPIEQFVHKHPDYDDDERVLERLNGLHAQCPGMRGEGSAEMKLGPNGIPRADVKIGDSTFTMDVDDNTTYVVLSAARAAELGTLGLGEETVIMASRFGALKGRIGTVPVIRVGKAAAHNVEVAVVEKVPGGADGLLGLSFISRFDANYDSVKCGAKNCTALVLGAR